ncbi:MAG: NAD(P)H-quinone oxidoreductase subunit F, partial [Okeania sp. SIO3B3]|nr:NAD(P)H-quinone oxidoreductase subunit F [Okeania sp. SIO3B3]
MIEFLTQNCWWIPFYGLVGATLTLPWSTGIIQRTGPRPAAYFNILMTLLAFIHGSIVYQAVCHQEPREII